MVGVAGVCDGFKELFVAGGAAAVFGRAGAGAGDAVRVVETRLDG